MLKNLLSFVFWQITQSVPRISCVHSFMLIRTHTRTTEGKISDEGLGLRTIVVSNVNNSLTSVQDWNTRMTSMMSFLQMGQPSRRWSNISPQVTHVHRWWHGWSKQSRTWSMHTVQSLSDPDVYTEMKYIFRTPLYRWRPFLQSFRTFPPVLRVHGRRHPLDHHTIFRAARTHARLAYESSFVQFDRRLRIDAWLDFYDASEEHVYFKRCATANWSCGRIETSGDVSACPLVNAYHVVRLTWA